MVTPASVCFDTSTCIDVLRNHRSQGGELLRFIPEGASWISSIVLAELARGVHLYHDAHRERSALHHLLAVMEVRPFDAAAANMAGMVMAVLQRAGQRIGPLDALIGGHALAQGAVLMTSNPGEFERIEGLTVIDSRRAT